MELHKNAYILVHRNTHKNEFFSTQQKLIKKLLFFSANMYTYFLCVSLGALIDFFFGA